MVTRMCWTLVYVRFARWKGHVVHTFRDILILSFADSSGTKPFSLKPGVEYPMDFFATPNIKAAVIPRINIY